MTPEEFNSTYSIGTSVNYHPVIGQAEHIKTVTLSPATTGIDPVIRVKDKAGWVRLDAISIDPEVEKYVQMGQRIQSHEWDCLCAGCIAFVEQGDKVHAMGLQA